MSGGEAKYVAAPLVVLPGLANACTICVSNGSYNMAPFTAVWIVALFGWTAYLGGLLWYRKRHDRDPLPLREHFRSAWKYLLVVVVLYVAGLHLLAVLLLPLLLVRAGFLHRYAHTRTVRIGARVLLAFLVITAPIFYKILPQTLSETEARVRATAIKKDLQVIAARSEKEAAGKVDPFAYETFDIPVLNIIVQSFGFYRPLDSDNKLSYTSIGEQRAAWSRGPDGDVDLSKQTVGSTLQQGRGGISQMLTKYSYDPTNGLLSKGDIVELTW